MLLESMWVKSHIAFGFFLFYCSFFGLGHQIVYSKGQSNYIFPTLPHTWKTDAILKLL